MKEERVKKLRPMFTDVLVTCNKYEEEVEDNGIIDTEKTEGAIKEHQTVLAVGSLVRNFTVGEVVAINPNRFAVKQYQDGSLKDGVVTQNPIIAYNFPIILVDGKDCMLLHENDIMYIAEEMEEVEVEDTPIIDD